ncbi:MAG: hypothetical protein H7234_03770, partial [Herminiimonas sp.]|nr:hypothetical protein [Herminiimonas sp.]
EFEGFLQQHGFIMPRFKRSDLKQSKEGVAFHAYITALKRRCFTRSLIKTQKFDNSPAGASGASPCPSNNKTHEQIFAPFRKMVSP